MGDGLTLNKQDEQRAMVLGQVGAGVLGIAEAAVLIGVGERQVRRLLASYQRDGPRGIVHGNRGRRPIHATSAGVREQVVALATGNYAGVNHSHMAELLAEREGLTLSRTTLRRVLTEAGIISPRPQERRSRHRARRDRYPQEGMLLQIDASLHRWFGPDLPHVTLLGVIDDATNKVPAAIFQPREDARGYMALLRQVVCRTGVPHALYSDRHSTFWPTNGESLKEQLAGRRSPTQFGRAMDELGVHLIAAHSPQAKGRVERLWGTLQDRLVSELRLAGITTIEAANIFLRDFLPRFNRRFAVTPEVPDLAYRPRLTAATADAVLCFKHERVVANDNTVRLHDMLFQILPGPHRLGYAKATVTICESLSGRYSLFHDGRPCRRNSSPHASSSSPTPSNPSDRSAPSSRRKHRHRPPIHGASTRV